ncbi:MAG: DUF3221 domain-containing protein [Paenisporosarcina sp.]
MRGKSAVFLIVGLVLLAIVLAFGSIHWFFKTSLNQVESSDVMEMDGIVVEIDDQKVLLIEVLSKKEVEGKSTEQLLEEGLNAIWFSLSIDQLKGVKQYDRLKVDFDQVSESYPGQASAKRVEILEE